MVEMGSRAAAHTRTATCTRTATAWTLNGSRWTYGSAEAVVRQSYRSVLGRDPDPSGLRSWTQQVVNNNWTQGDLDNALRQSERGTAHCGTIRGETIGGGNSRRASGLRSLAPTTRISDTDKTTRDPPAALRSRYRGLFNGEMLTLITTHVAHSSGGPSQNPHTYSAALCADARGHRRWRRIRHPDVTARFAPHHTAWVF